MHFAWSFTGKGSDSSTGIWIQRDQGREALKTDEPALDCALAQKTDVRNITERT